LGETDDTATFMDNDFSLVCCDPRRGLGHAWIRCDVYVAVSFPVVQEKC